jgi:hypothetical protein
VEGEWDDRLYKNPISSPSSVMVVRILTMKQKVNHGQRCTTRPE